MSSGGRDNGLRENIEGGGRLRCSHKTGKKVIFFLTQQNTQYGHQFQGRVIRIVRIKAIHAPNRLLISLGVPFGGVKPDMVW